MLFCFEYNLSYVETILFCSDCKVAMLEQFIIIIMSVLLPKPKHFIPIIKSVIQYY